MSLRSTRATKGGINDSFELKSDSTGNIGSDGLIEPVLGGALANSDCSWEDLDFDPPENSHILNQVGWVSENARRNSIRSA